MNATNGQTHGVSAYEADLDQLYSWMPPQPAPQPCPEALFSCTVRGTLGGHETLLTVRGMSAAEFRQNLQQVRGLLDAPAQSPTTIAPLATTPQCPTHGAMKPSTKRGGWYCPHKTAEGQWCPAKGGRG
jgi:hypothetical protein